LLLSGVAAGLAQLTKSSAIVMLVPIGIVMLIQIAQQWNEGTLKKAVWDSVKVFAIWLLVLFGAYFIFWPGMWVAPGKMLYQVYGNAFSYTFQGARLAVTENLEVSEFSLDTNVSAFADLINVLIWRTTPLTWLGVLFGFTLPFTRSRELVHTNKHLFTLLLFTAAAFIFIFGIAQGRNSPHYLLTSYLTLNLLAALGWSQVIKWFMDRLASSHSEKILYTSLFLLFLIQAWSALSFYPYYYSYRNPVLYSSGMYANFPQNPYGEGLELAAQYLAGLPNSQNSVALTYYARGCFSYFYPGETTRFKPYYVDNGHEMELVHEIRSADYVVLYYANQSKFEKYDPLFEALSITTPLHEIWMDGYKYVTIYKVGDFTPAVFEALEK
jgi:hypothetical protein